MCLYSDSRAAMVAEKDIECYKLVRPYYGRNDEYATYFMCFKIDADIVNGEKPLVGEKIFVDGQISENFDTLPSIRDYKYKIRDNYIHTFANLEDFETLGFKNFNVFKCVIPKGAKFFMGQFPIRGNSLDAFCSSEIIFKEKIQ